VMVVWLLAAQPVGAADTVGLVDPATGIWYLREASGEVTGFFYGNPGDVPFVGDWDCDGIDTPGLYRQSDGFAYLRNSNSQGVADIRFFFGNPGDFPLAGDFDGDGCDTLSIYRPSEATIYVINELGANDGGLGAAEFSYIFGNPGDKPFVGDFDGDGIDTLGLHRESTGFVYFRQTHTQGNADAEFFFGDPADRLVAGDWGVVDGEDTPAIFRPSNSTFFFRYTNTQGIADETLVFGASTFLPIAGEWGTVAGGGPGQPGQPPAGPGPLAVGSTLPNATLEVPYAANITITGGTPPYSVQKTGGTSWANVSSGGAVSGTPFTLGGSNLLVTVTDSAGVQVSAAIPITVVNKCSTVTGTTVAQCQALSQFYTATNGQGWIEQTNWFSPNPCTWHGISCSGGDSGNVTGIEMDGNNLTGAIDGSTNPMNWAALPTLTVFDINENQVGQSLPVELVALPLTTLDVGDNDMFGAVPPGVWTKAGLITLDLSENGFDGTIPDVTWNVIQNVDLSLNVFEDALPASIWTMTTLVTLDLADNEFTGSIPPEVAQLAGISALNLSDNLMSGMIPDQITTLGVISLQLHGNGCFTANAGATTLYLDARDINWDDGCVVP